MSHAFRSGGAIAVKSGADERHEMSCFADEVVIDFPSAARAIERIRYAFVADERQRSMPAELQLSRLEAQTGVTVPVDVPVRATCRRCGGRGETWTERCAACGGTGTELLTQQVQVVVPAGVEHGDRFYFSIGVRHDTPTRIELRVLVA